MKQFKGRVALVTGAASGLGAAFVDEAVALGMHLVIIDIDAAALDQTASRLTGAGVQVLSQACDVADAEAMQTLADAVQRRFGAVHLLFNNAGVAGGNGFAWESSVKDWQWGLGVNLWGVIHGIRSFVPLMVAAAQADPAYEGHIVNTSSMAGFFNPPIMAIYNASKQAVTAISETLHHDLQIAGVPIGCSLLAPFFVATGIADSERHRPAQMRNETALLASQQAQQDQARLGMASASLTAAEVAQMTFDAVRMQQFYVFPHPGMLRSVERRMKAVLAQEAPVDPFYFRPEIFEGLRAKLAVAGRPLEDAQTT